MQTITPIAADEILIARALYRAVRIAEARAPYDTLHLKVLYPARLSNSPEERNTGHVPVDATRALLIGVIANFIDGAIRQQPEAQQRLTELLHNNPQLVLTKCK